MTLQQSLKALNEAAYAVLRAGADTRQYPHLDRQSLYDIAAITDRLVDEIAPAVETAE